MEIIYKESKPDRLFVFGDIILLLLDSLLAELLKAVMLQASA